MFLGLRVARLFAQHSARCVILHPVSYPNQGPIVEQYLAEEALGLVKSLGWSVLKGPFWNNANKIDLPTYRSGTHLFISGDPDQLQDGDYVKTSLGSGTLHGDGIFFEQEESEDEDELYKEWQNKITRQSLANSSLVKVRNITKKYYFSKGKLHFLIDYLKTTDFDCLYIDADLKPTQLKNLKKVIEARVNNISLSKAYPVKDQFDSETEFQTEDSSPLVGKRNLPSYRKINVFDRFSIILQIFAARTTSKLAKLQVELSYLTYIRTRLIREGNTYLTTMGNFSVNLFSNTETPMEVISAKQRKAARTLGGQGQSQLELERRRLRDREAQIRRDIEEEARLRNILMEKRERRGTILPVVALVGYTNVGKSAFMNTLMKKKQVDSKDLLFQTLSTTTRSVVLPSGTKISLLDTIGFITNLPVEMVQAFKTTLQQIAHADLVIHLRDCSHPHNELQKKSVLTILEELGFGKAFQEERMLEVWNKVDLVSQRPQGTAISCITSEGVSQLTQQIENKLMVIRGIKKRDIQYDLNHHNYILEWIKAHTNHTYNVEAEYNYQTSKKFPNGSVRVSLYLDDVAMGKLYKLLHPQKSKQKSKKGMPPKQGW